MFLVTSPIVIYVPTRGLLAVETMHAIVQWLENLNIKRNLMSMFVNKKRRYTKGGALFVSVHCLNGSFMFAHSFFSSFPFETGLSMESHLYQ